MEENKLTLSTDTAELEKQLLEENDPDKLKNIIDLFNLSIKKKDIVRTGKLNELQDKTLQQITERIEKYPDLFSNKDLLDYYKTIQDTINKCDAVVNNTNIPNIQINQNIVNVEGEDPISAESKRRVIEAVRKMIAQCDTVIDADVVKQEDK